MGFVRLRKKLGEEIGRLLSRTNGGFAQDHA